MKYLVVTLFSGHTIIPVVKSFIEETRCTLTVVADAAMIVWKTLPTNSKQYQLYFETGQPIYRQICSKS